MPTDMRMGKDAAIERVEDEVGRLLNKITFFCDLNGDQQNTIEGIVRDHAWDLEFKGLLR